ncbi:MAG: TetR/AcrR family transcriptional regulator [Pedobacter sp.]|uniref:TetR/AcrR family transcriptional regulator n=1 Tax=Pedobacter sp. TaxID=1411316 RepID=UPI0028085CBC|nr:TetR/AcrR family transcriptional regulator [Pedobacter sp.]MDQ8005728.1 TetR/AcrR family transcriptional regulator [Pedobacter sp.]
MEVRDYIIDGADKLFCQYGFKSVTMDDIAKHLGISKKTIYQNFKDKNELINILIHDRIVNQDLQMNKCFVESENAVQEVFFSMQDMDYFLATMNPMLFYDLQKYHQQAWQNFVAFKEKEIGKTIMANLERGKKEGLYREELNTEIITRLRLDQVEVVFSQNEHYDTKKNSLASIMIEITRHFLYGICNKEGVKLIHKYDAEFLSKQENAKII